MDNIAIKPVDPQLISRRFGDIDALNEAATAWDANFRQLDRGPLTADLLQVGAEGRLLSSARFNRRIDQQGAAPAGAFTFAVPYDENPRIVWRSRVVPKGSMIVYRPGSEIDGASRPGFSVLTLSVAVPLFKTACIRAGRSDLVEATHELELVTPDPATLRRFVSALARTARWSSTIAGLSSRKRQLEYRFDDLTAMAIEALASSRPTPKAPSIFRRSLVIRRAVEHLRAHENEPVTVGSLSEAAGVSERTLQYAFVERFDVTPKRYVQAHRLQGVRRLLRSDSSAARVADIANHFGFWHMGQFAADYRRQFGELPSETLSRGRTTDRS